VIPTISRIQPGGLSAADLAAHGGKQRAESEAQQLVAEQELFQADALARMTLDGAEAGAGAEAGGEKMAGEGGAGGGAGARVAGGGAGAGAGAAAEIEWCEGCGSPVESCAC